MTYRNTFATIVLLLAAHSAAADPQRDALWNAVRNGDLKAIQKNQAEDVALLANDIIDVPVDGVKATLRSLMGSVVPSVGQLPVRVIP